MAKHVWAPTGQRPYRWECQGCFARGRVRYQSTECVPVPALSTEIELRGQLATLQDRYDRLQTQLNRRTLSPRHVQIAQRRLTGATLEAIAVPLGLTRERVRQICARVSHQLTLLIDRRLTEEEE